MLVFRGIIWGWPISVGLWALIFWSLAYWFL
jgi:hypothetical protein